VVENSKYEFNRTLKFKIGVLRATMLKKAKIMGFYLALNVLLGLNDLKYSLPIA
jgi:hypothetical protein